MRKNIRLIHIKELTRENIFKNNKIIENMQSEEFEFYELMLNNNSYQKNNVFLNEIKNYCSSGKFEKFTKIPYIPENYENIILVNIDNSLNNNGKDQIMDYICIQHLLAFLYNLNEDYMVYFYRSDANSDAIANYYRVSNYLNLWLSQTNKKNYFRYLDLYEEISSNEKNANPKRLAYSFSKNKPSETILPIVSLNRDIYYCLNSPYNNEYKYSLNKLLENLKNDNKQEIIIQYYKEYINQAIEKLLSSYEVDEFWCELEKDFIRNSPPLIVVYIYATIVAHIEKSDLNKLTFQSVVEKSYDYAQGLMQLIENSIKHVVESEEDGCAFFSIRMHHKIGELNDYLNDTDFKELKYFLEISVMDCTLKLNNVGIVSKFNEVLTNSNLGSIKSLNEVFDYPNTESTPLDDYYSKVNNISNHYGLQIFDTILTSNNGLFIVKSGLKSFPDIYTNESKVIYNGKLIYKVKEEKLKEEHFSGTSYTIILPLNKTDGENISEHISLSNIPLELKANFEETQSKALNPIILSKTSKELAVNEYIKKINEIVAENNNSIIAININEISKSRIHMELLCKAVISVISNNQKNDVYVICLLDICNEYMLLDAVRIIALFYDKTGICNFMNNKGIYLSCENKYNILFSGNNIKSVLENVKYQRLIKSLPETFYRHIINAMIKRVKKEQTGYISDISPSLIKCSVKNNGYTLAQRELEEILNNDIHEKSLGCKISNTHIRIGKVHLDTFYEAQLLFGNAYWTDIFAYYFYKFILHQLKVGGYKKEKPIILYGYETYSTLTLGKTILLLEKDGYEVNTRIYEVRDNRVRYCDESIGGSSLYDEEISSKEPVIFFFVGISSTLSTFKHMDDALVLINNNYKKVDKYCTSVIQVVGDDNKESSFSKRFIEEKSDIFGRYVVAVSQEDYLRFIKEENLRKAYFYISVKSVWYNPESCELCMPKDNYLKEHPLIEVNEASVVPTQIIRLNKTDNNSLIDKKQEHITKKFLNNMDNKKYLHYGHIERNNNHYQYYFRLSRLYYDKKSEIEEWLKELKEEYEFSINKAVNIIVAPQHYSNTGFINSVNNIIFKGTAHIIEFDLHKEYRNNFKAKYNNYSELEKIIDDLEDYEIDFYYVDDQIISGSSFYRTKSLINSLFEQQKSSFHVFKGIFVLLNRNSLDSQKNYVKALTYDKNGIKHKYLPYFSFLNIQIPSLRSYDDSCPICFNISKFFNIIDECSLDTTVLHWQKKIISYRKKSISEVRKDNTNYQASEKKYRMLQCENDLWIAVNNAYNSISETKLPEDINIIDNIKKDKIVTAIYSQISLRLEKIEDDTTKIEYLISYIKAMSQALLHYQEDIKKVCIYILLKIFDFFLSSAKISKDKVKCSFKLFLPIGDKSIELDLKDKKTKKLKYDLYRVTISRLCTVGSCALLNAERLKKCRKIGNYMHIRTKKYEQSFDDFLLNSLKKLLCYDKGASKAIALKNNFFNEVADISDFDDEFYIKLFLENMRNPNLTKEQAIVEQIKSLNNQDITKRYEMLVEILQSTVPKTENLEMRIFTQVDRDELKFVPITGGTISMPPRDESFIYEKNKKILYIRIGNNFQFLREELEKEKQAKVLEKELKIVKSASIILGIKADTIESVGKIISYRKEIIEMVETDFNNDAILKLINTNEKAKILSEIKTVTHNQKPLQEFGNIFNNMYTLKAPLELQRNFLSLYMDTIISIAYRERLRYQEYKFSSYDSENSMFEIGYNIVGKRLEYAEDQINAQYGNTISIEIGVEAQEKEKKFLAYSIAKQAEIKKQFEQSFKSIRMRKSDEICEIYMVMKTFIDNAYKHCKKPEIWIRLIETAKGVFDLVVENTNNSNEKNLSYNGITLDSLDYIYNENNFAGKQYFEHPKKDEKLDIYRITIKEFIIKED